ncbi:hypothetical protein FQA39_LY01008 [Lamprigera yunnana]|nr:hypothetical protein FQA39_LY01008 [Lamprigera yunnana]
MSNAVEMIEKRNKLVPAIIVKDTDDSKFQIKVVDKVVRVCVRTGVMNETLLTSTETRNEPGKHSPKRYVTTCYFQPKQNPVSYSETVILTLGSKKKHYFDTVMYQTQLVPMRWTESMTTVTAPEDEFEANYECFMEVPNYHYISLESQQLVAQEKLTV